MAEEEEEEEEEKEEVEEEEEEEEKKKKKKKKRLMVELISRMYQLTKRKLNWYFTASVKACLSPKGKNRT